MTRFTVTEGGPVTRMRRSIGQVKASLDAGPSPQGSTYYKMLLACPREWALYYVVRLRPEVISEALTVGLLYHSCLEKHYEMIRTGSAFSTGMAAAYSVLDVFRDEDGYQEIVETVSRVLTGYFDRYEDDAESWKILAAEETLIFEGAFTYSARLDLVIEDKNDKGLWIVEHKTTAAISANLIDSYQLDLQILGQAWLLEHCIDKGAYLPIHGVRINIATKHKGPPSGKGPQYTRVDVSPSRYHMAAFVRAVTSWTELREDFALHGYPQSLGCCAGYARGYGRCQYYDICHGFPQVSVDDWVDVPDEHLPMGFARVK